MGGRKYLLLIAPEERRVVCTLTEKLQAAGEKQLLDLVGQVRDY